MSDDEEGGAGASEILDESPFRWKKLFADVTEIDRQPHMYYGGWYWIRQPDGNYGCNYVMVLDDGRCFIGVEDIMGRAGVSFRRLPEVKPEPRWHAPFVKDFVRGDSSNPDEDNVYDLCLNAFRSYIDYEEPGAAMLMALYTIQTYLMPIFDTTAYILITGPKRSGKSKNFDVAEQLVFNPVRAVNMSVSSIFRIIEDWQATLLIDESDLDLPEKAAGIRTILLSGYKRGLFVLRTEKTTKDRHFVERYDVFGPKMIVAPQGVAETMREQMLLDRCIPITMQRTTDELLTKRSVRPSDPFWADIRHHLYCFALKHWREVADNLLEMPDKLPLMSREYEKWSPLFAVAEYFGLFDELFSFCREKVSEVFLEEESESSEVKLLRFLIHLFRSAEAGGEALVKESVMDGLEGYYVSSSELVMRLEQHYGKESWINPRSIGRILTSVFALNRKPLKIVRSGKPYYFLEKRKLERLAEKYGINFENPLEV